MWVRAARRGPPKSGGESQGLPLLGIVVGPACYVILMAYAVGGLGQLSVQFSGVVEKVRSGEAVCKRVVLTWTLPGPPPGAGRRPLLQAPFSSAAIEAQVLPEPPGPSPRRAGGLPTPC